MAEDTFCIQLYPPGTLGRLFIDLALKAIMDLAKASVEYREEEDKLCILDPVSLAGAIETIATEASKDIRGNPFPQVGHDKGIFRRIIVKDYGDEGKTPTTLLKYIADILRAGGYNRLAEEATAPSLMRIEFYEYGRPGFITRITGKHKEYMHKKANVLSIGLAVLGAYISYTALGRDGNLYAVFFIPYYGLYTTSFDIEGVKEIKRRVSMIYDAPASIQSYVAARIAREYSLPGGVIGETIYITLGRNKLTLYRREKISGSGWIELISMLLKEYPEDTVRTLDKIVSAILSYLTRRGKQRSDELEKGVKPLIKLIEYIHRYSLCDEESRYMAIRTAREIADILEARERREASEAWRPMINVLRNYGGIDKPYYFRMLAEALATVDYSCSGEYFL